MNTILENLYKEMENEIITKLDDLGGRLVIFDVSTCTLGFTIDDTLWRSAENLVSELIKKYRTKKNSLDPFYKIKKELAEEKCMICGEEDCCSEKCKLIKSQRIPKWLTQKDFESMRCKYEKAASMTKQLGAEYHVDHIIPLQGDNVSGLHCPDNLKIVFSDNNTTKYRKFTSAIKRPDWLIHIYST